MDNTLQLLKQSFHDAKQEERQQSTMANYIEKNLSSLHASIAISAPSPSKALMSFVEDYIDIAPEHIQALYTLAKEAQLEKYVNPFLDLSYIYFINPPDLLAPFNGLQKLLHQAYLAHRLMEEVNDKVMNLSGGAALAPMDMCMANIISHALIGDKIANQLDHLVLLAMETTKIDAGIFEKQNVRSFLEKRKAKDWEEITKRWPCFTRDCAINLQINA
ncbi:MAG: hypothetical protein ACJAUP_000462 [Cellvibrionaceae bacterium]|jgi:hypothetical protein